MKLEKEYDTYSKNMYFAIQFSKCKPKCFVFRLNFRSILLQVSLLQILAWGYTFFPLCLMLFEAAWVELVKFPASQERFVFSI